jgi:hypothetical protein
MLFQSNLFETKLGFIHSLAPKYFFWPKIMPIVLDKEDVPMTPSAGVPPSVPVDKSLDPGEAIVPSDTVDVMAAIVALNETFKMPETPASDDNTTATLIISAILIYFLIKIVFRFLPWILGITAVIILLKMYGGA